MVDESTDPRTVFVAENPQLAVAVVQLLEGGGIAAETFSPSPRAETQALTGMTEIAPSGGIEIRVVDPGKAKAAKELLDTAVSAAAVKAIRDKRANRTGTVTVVCEDCGKSSDWPATAMGTTENCPQCAGYIDIPDPDDDWDGVDFGADEEEDEGQEDSK